MADRTPQEIQNTLGVTSITLRRWCDYHKAYLSTGTQPRNGQARRFTGKDLEVLRHVQSLRDQGMTTAIINGQLSTITFAEIDDQPDNSADDQGLPDTLPDNAITIVDAPEQPDATPANIVGQDYLMSIERRFEAMQASIDEVKQAPVATHSRMADIVLGVLLALGFMVVILLLAVLYGK